MSDPNIHVTQNVGEVKEGGKVIGVQVTYQGEPVLIPTLEDMQLHRAELTKLPNYSRWADEFYIREEGKVLLLYASPYEDDSGRKREDLLQTIRSHQRLLVLGEPGMGKTVAMERMMWETAKAEEPVVPILVQLLYFQGTDLTELIRVALNETKKLTFENAKSVRAFLRETKCLILLDGLNEVPGKQRDQVIGAIANLMREYPEHRYVVTSRSQDELWRKLRSSDLIKDAVVVQNISDEQAQGYLKAHLGNETGQALYGHLDASLKALARIPLLLWLIKEAGQGTYQLPRNRGELFDKFVMNRLMEREKKLELVETPEAKKRALAKLAFALQMDHGLACDREWAEKVLTEQGLGNKAASILNEALLHGLLLQQHQPEKQLLRFMHQSAQEYFVALTLLREAQIEKGANPLQNAARQFSKHNLRYWAKDAWWNESFVQLAGLVNDADWLARRIVNASPWLAWWCVEEGREVQDTTRDLIETRSIKLLRSDKVAERRRAVQTLAQIKNERAIEPLLIAAGDDDMEVSGLAVQALVEIGDAVHLAARQVMQGNNKPAWQGALRFVGTQPDVSLWADIPTNIWEEMVGQTMVWVPAGAFLMGSDKSKDSKAYDNELPQRPVTLQGYWIGRFPVTVAQWKVFVKESGHQADGKSLQDPEDHSVRFVSWDDAMAYCEWLGEKSGLPVTLPSEAEWEKAARGTDARIYPWGDTFDKDKCNTHESGIGTTTPVGKYSPAGDSPYGCADMAGNVWEWTRSKHKDYPYNAEDGREDLGRGDLHMVRGGSWRNNRDLARASARDANDPRACNYNFGFRLVVRPPSL